MLKNDFGTMWFLLQFYGVYPCCVSPCSLLIFSVFVCQKIFCHSVVKLKISSTFFFSSALKSIYVYTYINIYIYIYIYIYKTTTVFWAVEGLKKTETYSSVKIMTFYREYIFLQQICTLYCLISLVMQIKLLLIVSETTRKIVNICNYLLLLFCYNLNTDISKSY